MKKVVRLICGAVAAIVLLNADIKWPMLKAEAEGAEDAAQHGLEDGAFSGEGREETQDSGEGGEIAPESGEESRQPGDGISEVQEPAGDGEEIREPEESAEGSREPAEGTVGSREPAEGAEGSREPVEGTEGNQEPAGSAEGDREPVEGAGGSREPAESAEGDREPAESAGGSREPAGNGGEAQGLAGDGEIVQKPGDGWKRTSGSMDDETAQWVEEAGEKLAQIAAERDIMALVYLSDTYSVRTLPSEESAAAVTVLSGQTVNILDVYVNDEPEVWYYVKLEYNGMMVYGYVQQANLVCSDARFLDWQWEYGLDFSAAAYTVDAAGVQGYPDIEQFPESYRPALTELKAKHPNWTFVKMNTTLDWGVSVSKELQGGKSLVYKTLPDWAKNGLYDTGNWYYASEAALKVYMDPRNSLSENAIFQFEQLTYNEAYHTLDAVNTFLKSTFMNDSRPAPGTDTTYANLFWTIGREEARQVSPFHLAARVLQEQGAGTSPLISGTYPGYEGYYNYFNVGASGTTNAQVIKSGLEYAKNHGWSSVEAAIRGGADFISANYIRRGQDTLYLQKFNVNPNGFYAPYTHQYMQNISAPTTEASSIKRLYESAGALDSTFVFKIPVYENMPAEPCGIPGVSTEIALPLPEGYNTPVMWLDGVAYQGEIRNGSLIAAAADGSAKTAVIYKYNEAGVPTGMYVWELGYNGVAYTATPLPGLEDLLTYHGFSIRITGKTGIRFKTGISADLRGRLTSGGVDGYSLKEYGTLVTSNANLGQYPMIKGGQKIASGLSYGMDGNGAMQDLVFETVDGRYRFTSVLVGLPVEQYKTEFAFRGYAVLEKNGVQTTVYGPVVARSIYALAGQLVGQGTYPAGSDADVFLRKLISDADALTP